MVATWILSLELWLLSNGSVIALYAVIWGWLYPESHIGIIWEDILLVKSKSQVLFCISMIYGDDVIFVGASDGGLIPFMSGEHDL